MPLPDARVIPTAVLASGGRRRLEQSLASIGNAPDANIRAPISHIVDPGPALLQLDTASASSDHLYELGLTTAAMGYHTAALEALGECTRQAPDHAPAWRKLAELLRLAGEDGQAESAEMAAVTAVSAESKWPAASGVCEVARVEKAEQRLRKRLDAMRQAGASPEEGMAALREHLAADPLDAAAMRLLAQMEKLGGDAVTALRLQERALDLCPDYVGVREDHASLLVERQAHADAGAQITRLLSHAPRNPHYRHLQAWALLSMGDGEVALDILSGLLREAPREAKTWLMYAQALHFLGRTEECAQAYRHCLELQPSMGEAYWGLADLKGNFITEADIAAMRAELNDNGTLDPGSARRMLYTIGQALERAGKFEASFAAYEEGVRIALEAGANRRGNANVTDDVDTDGADPLDRVLRMKKVFSRENLQTRLKQAPLDPGRDTPIFIVGLPRAGSTLTEQILASHSQVEGTRELSLIGDITRELGHTRMLVVQNAYPECLLDLNSAQLSELGARYIERSRNYRKSERRYFIDKRPWNWLEVGLIHMILPQAKIIDIRREPMAACFAMFKQLLPNFTYDLDGLGHYYNKYVHLMEHWQDVLPGRVHFVKYERLVEDTEAEIRRMLDYCGLPFEDSCLRFWETDRVVSTPSSQQVRRPIYRNALEQWRNFEPWLGPLKKALAEPVRV